MTKKKPLLVPVLAGLIAFTLLLAGCTQQIPGTPRVACDAMLRYCPDGSIQKVGPHCEQLPCPPLRTNAQGCSNDLFPCPDGTNVGRIQPDCMFAPCTPTHGPDLQFIYPEKLLAKDSFYLENSNVRVVYLGRDCGQPEENNPQCQSGFQFLAIQENSGTRKQFEAPFSNNPTEVFGEVPFVLKRARVFGNGDGTTFQLEIKDSCPQRPLVCPNGQTPANSGEDCNRYVPCESEEKSAVIES